MKTEDFFDRLSDENEEFRRERALASAALDLARNVHRLRRVLDWSQTELAEKAGTSQPRIAEIEAGAGNPTLRTLSKLAGVLGVTVDNLVAPTEVQVAEEWESESLPSSFEFKTPIDAGETTILVNQVVPSSYTPYGTLYDACFVVPGQKSLFTPANLAGLSWVYPGLDAPSPTEPHEATAEVSSDLIGQTEKAA